ncbi:NAD(P)/FAD-dependent oxidoreductase, partial [Halalkalibacillus halophilus]|uniref:NAD(P)/FAD-dependent oxidoreductase n=1 Tax=Halalkalibacillus halophilus TaxID=392827 RepID=UPI0004036057
MSQYVVIGAGVLGASTAYQLSKKGVDVTLIDQFHFGEATRAAAGIISPWLSQKNNPEVYSILQKGAAYYEDLQQELHQIGINDIGYRKVSSIHLHKDESKLSKMITDVKGRREEAPEIGEVNVLTGKDVQETIPFMSDRMGAVQVEGGGRVHGETLKDSLIRAAKMNGATVRQGEAILNGEHQLYVNGAPVEYHKLIVTNGAWIHQLIKKDVLPFEITSTKTQIVYLQGKDHLSGEWPVIMLPNNKYIVGFDNGRIAIGAEHLPNNDFEPQLSAGSVLDLLKIIFKFAPGLKEAKWIDTRVGFRPSSSLNEPVLQVLPSNPNIIIGNGLGSSGMTSGPYLGLKLAEMALYQ